ncbi:MFS transporter [Paraburkholderia sp. DHOC27]|uniref:MFS transporter n=1 Tax=Paraburkholderia sp. DHOC27 TaxID=2303330 RepID=UPI000E3DA2BF|nr:MFS transporter [Paraburkholderia sp. DHOC27]RFU49298.1 MFS transporter [Paraburkholderia sp. DHOC27]
MSAQPADIKPHDPLPYVPASSLPVSGLLALAMTGFVAILTETLPAGLLPGIGQGLHVSESWAGQLVTLYALGSVVAAIPMTVATRSWSRRTVVLLAIAGFLLFNTVTAVSSSFALTLFARFMAGVAAGITWGSVPGYARRMVAPHLQGRAMALALIGTPIALAIGVPAGTWLGDLVGWRVAFGGMSALTALLIVWVLKTAPHVPGQDAGKRQPVVEVFKLPGVRPVLLVILAWMLAHNILYTYIAPFLEPAHMTQRVDTVLLVFGGFAIAGIWITGVFIDRWLRVLVLASLATFAIASAALGIDGRSAVVLYLAVAAWGLTFGGAATLLQTASADAAGDNADTAQSMIVTVWNGAIAGGGVIGGVLLDTTGVDAMAWVLLALLLVALYIAWRSCAHAFKPGARTAV